ncbi:lipoprotein N-acyltransferase Lnb domain-containing protein [Wenyingzhuangia sp. IMCC45533]
MRLFFLLILLLSTTFNSSAQSNIKLSDKAEVSILTCDPGVNELYSYFGHSAIRVKDKANNLDKVYNYGMFDFSAPNFYLNFCRGKLLYKVVGYSFKYFPYQYALESRSIKTQVLNLTLAQSQKVFNFLEWNIKPENKNYYYDFFYDNCATKMYEVVEKSIGNITFDYSDFPKDKTHRDLIHQYLPKNSWSKFGIDLALGAVIDEKANFKEYMFLPDYVSLGFKNAKINSKELVKNEKFILEYSPLKYDGLNFFLSPLFVSLFLLALSLFLLLKNNKFSISYFNAVSIFYGLLGIVLLALWFLTEHSTTKVNLNVFWANPLLLAIPWIKSKYKKVICIVHVLFFVLFLCVGFFKIQEYNSCFYVLSLVLIPWQIKNLLTAP